MEFTTNNFYNEPKIEITESGRNLKGVFLTLTKRPELIFNDIKYCVEQQCSKPEKVRYVELLTRFSNQPNLGSSNIIVCEVFIKNKDNFALLGLKSEDHFTVLVCEKQTLNIYSCCSVFLQESGFNFRLNSLNWTKDVTSSKHIQLINWLTSESFQLKPRSNFAVCPKRYFTTYKALKDKYFLKIKEVWDMQTDADKFIAEDIGIASYLICLWQSRYGTEAQKQVNFIDIGCGNGLLVYLLNQEHFKGDGIDIRARSIWSTAFSTSTLKEACFDPNNWETIKDYNYTWLIGNHSDELTPWLPYVSLMISYECEFFVLPCCAWNFNSKFSRSDVTKSVYQCYLDFIENVIKDFGFDYQRDIMKIPSTKRTCFLSNGHEFDKSAYQEMKMKASQIIDRYSDKVSNDSFAKRSTEIVIKNASRVDRALCDSIVSFTASLLLRNVSKDDPVWSDGTSIHLNEIITEMQKNISFSEDLKQQNGGIQTVLRNHHQTFIIQGGMVSLRNWSKDLSKPYRKVGKNRKYDSAALHKSKLCWFFLSHPQGCNLPADVCKYAHGEEELKRVEFK